ncbi:MAG: bifunctional riboflavin kinase/FAD synthetase [Candidatus Sumerlaeaceae bacterium]|nr:bifunctional riboflavin kinase/FAD synthetase [Candidatus Sumerlaeaceae bacterium]
MKTITALTDLPNHLEPTARTAVTIGVFDGLHLGHQQLIRRTVALARKRNLKSLVMTFTGHPLELLAPPYCPKKLIYPERKERLIERMGADLYANLAFSSEFAAQSPENFARDVLAGQCRANLVVCGYDFAFGKSGAGKIPLLRELGTRLGFEVQVVNAVAENGIHIKSTMVRDQLLSGHVEDATRMLSRPYELRGNVVPGHARGRQIGFPTANLAVDPAYIIPARGVYACAASIHGTNNLHPAMVNIGNNPTFGENQLSIEAHILDFDGDLTGKMLSLFFLKRLRNEQKFSGVDALVRQLKADRETVNTLWGVKETGNVLTALQAWITTRNGIAD